MGCACKILLTAVSANNSVGIGENELHQNREGLLRHDDDAGYCFVVYLGGGGEGAAQNEHRKSRKRGNRVEGFESYGNDNVCVAGS
jgi:hypothetical protein